MKPRIDDKKKARELRQQGLSLKQISEQLNISKGSLSPWVRDIILTEEQYKLLHNRRNLNSKKASLANQEKCLEKRKEYQKIGKEKAKEKNPLHIAGCMLYWAEGGKKGNKSSIQFTNSDPFMVKLFLNFLKNNFNITNNMISISLRHYTDLISIEEAHSYWLNILNLPKECLRKSIIDYQFKWSKNKKHGYMKYGCCRLCVHRTEIIQQIYGAIKEYAGIDDPELYLN